MTHGSTLQFSKRRRQGSRRNYLKSLMVGETLSLRNFVVAACPKDLSDAFPHPGLLPTEKENRSPSAWKSVRLDWPDGHPPLAPWRCIRLSRSSIPK